ncbi:MAG: UV DNA damage repair endonuclease UvsE [Chlamydiales bacterium]|nr:UV DNA damage repair endonuclease UvsE [Chlamydiales bacterium]
MLRLGLCCTFVDVPIKFRQTTVTYLKRLEKPMEHIEKIVWHNIGALEEAIVYCLEHNIGCFRINSQFLPAATHPEVGYTLKDLPEAFSRRLAAIGKRGEIRLTFHPDQFVVLSSPKEDVVANSLKEIESQASVAELVGADVINIHGGGAYGDKVAALARFERSMSRLSSVARIKVTVENDDKTYTPQELYPLCEKLGIPLVYDVHHHRCLPDEWSIEEATQKALSTWNREPLFHISSPLNGWDKKHQERHHDYIDIADFPVCWKGIELLTVEVEAKAKERAVAKLQQMLAK